MAYKYYSTLRPVSIGTYPKPPGNDVLEIYNFNSRVPVKEIHHAAWGWILYKDKLSDKDADNYDLIFGGEAKEE